VVMEQEAGARTGPGGVPALAIDIGNPGPVLSHFEEWDALRERYPAFWNENDGGHWVVTRYDAIRHALQEHSTFSNESTIISDPNPAYKLIPTFLDPPEHTKYRQLFNARFSPAMVDRVTDVARAACNDAIDGFIDRGHCDLIEDFADPYPTTVFLSALGLPLEDTWQFVQWVRAIFAGLSGKDPEGGAAAMGETRQYFKAMLDARRRQPKDADTDMVTYLLEARIDGEPIAEDDLLWMCMVLVLAGLDTTKSQLGYNFHHLATHPEDRRRIVADPSLIPSAVEELLRFNAFVPPARKLKRDVEFEGCPMKTGQMVLMPLWSATRDPRAFEAADEVRIDRPANRHIAFGAGPHRCAGAHLARRELLIAMEEWHKRIPDYQLADGQPLVEHGWQCGLDNLPLTWSA
jgi:cytochrome P450